MMDSADPQPTPTDSSAEGQGTPRKERQSNPEAKSKTRKQNDQPRVHAVGRTIWIAALIATLFTAWTPNSFFTSNLQEQLKLMLTPHPETNAIITPQPQLRIGIVAGHNGNDPGAVCLDSSGHVTASEAEVNLEIASQVQKKLVDLGFQVDLLNEFDTRLNGYRAVTLVSIHNDSCEYINEQATGFKVAASLDTRDVHRAQRLTGCLVDRYKKVTGLTYHAGSITSDMREYHAFSEIDPDTITAIIETGFLNLDNQILTKQPDQVADGVVQGILCFINNESIEPTPIPVLTP